MELSLNLPTYFRKYWQIDYLEQQEMPEIPMKSFIQSIAIIIAAVFVFGCPPKQEEPVSGSLVVTSKSEHLVMGNPSGAVDSVSFSNNYLMEKPQYVVSYSRDRGIPNWVAWHLDNTCLSDVP